MSDGFKVEFDGFEEMGKALKEMARGSAARVFRKSFASSIMHLESRLKATSAWADQTGELRGSVHAKTRSRKGAVTASVEGLYRGRYLEFGWVPGKRPGSRAARRDRALASRGFIPPRPWIRPVFEQDKAKIIQDISDGLSREVTATLLRHAKKQSRLGK